jgi:acyl-CoA reductase-like NAD-dependent aldehyde dehydrogenase
MSTIISTNPGKNYQVIGEVEVSTEAEIKAAVDQANQAKRDWKEMPLKKRIEILKKVEAEFKKHADEIALLITEEVGTPIAECKDEVSWDWGYWDWFLNNAEKALAPKRTDEDNHSIHEIWYEPTGTAAVITPWNLPFDLFVWGVIPNLLAGNTVVYKASEECILTGKLLAKIMDKTALPQGVFNAIHGNGIQGEQLVNQEIDLIWFTGSSMVGKKLYELAGKKIY